MLECYSWVVKLISFEKIIPPNAKSVLSSFKTDETWPNFDEVAGHLRINTIVKVRLERFAHEEDVVGCLRCVISFCGDFLRCVVLFCGVFLRCIGRFCYCFLRCGKQRFLTVINPRFFLPVFLFEFETGKRYLRATRG